MDNVNPPAAGGSKTGMWAALVIAVIVLGVGAYFLFARENGTNANNGNAVGNENANTATSQNQNVNSNTNSITDSNGNSNSIATADWKTYSNSSKGFQIQYPSGWETFERLDGTIAFAPATGSFPEVSVRTNDSGSTSVASLTSSLRSLTLVSSSEQNLTIDNLPVFLREGTSSTTLTDGSSWYIQRSVIDADQKIFEVDGNNASSVFQAMLDSFKQI